MINRDKQYMQAAWLEHNTLTFRGDVTVPKTGSGEALIKVLLAGICGTDKQLLAGYYPFRGIPGHEFVGEVISAPEHPGLQGKLVVGEININCGQCPQCLAKQNHHCRHRKVLGIKEHHGAFAQYLVLPCKNLHQVPKGLDPQQAVFTEPVAAAMRIQEQLDIGAQTRVLVIGAGKLGQLIAQTLKPTACRLQVMARYQHQRQILEQAGIACISEQHPPQEVDVVIEASGSPQALAIVDSWLRPQGTLVLKSTYVQQAQVDLSRIVVNEQKIIGSRCGPFEPALNLLASGQLQTDLLIDSIYPLSEVNTAMQRSCDHNAMKVLLQP